MSRNDRINISGFSFSQNKYKWPYFGSDVPPYIGISAGYEGFKANYFTAGLAWNFTNVTVHPAIGGLFGTVISYKQNLQKSNLYSLESELGVFGGLCFGVGLN